jgi:chromosome segregation ATPase
MIARRWWPLLVVGLLVSGTVFSQQDPAAKQAARERELLRRAQAAQKQAEEARGTLEAEKSKLADQLKDAESRAAKVAGSASKERKRADDLQRSLDETVRARDLLQKDKDGLTVRVAEVEKQLRETQAELARIRSALAEREAALTDSKAFGARETTARQEAEQKNARLYALSRDLIDKYRSQGFWDSVKRREPFTGLKQVEVENLLEGYRDRADDGRVVPASPR